MDFELQNSHVCEKRFTIKAVAFFCGPILNNECLSRLLFAKSLRASSPFGGYREKKERIKPFSKIQLVVYYQCCASLVLKQESLLEANSLISHRPYCTLFTPPLPHTHKCCIPGYYSRLSRRQCLFKILRSKQGAL